MNKFWKLLKYELLLCNRSYHLIRHSAYVMLLSNIIFSIMISTMEHTDHLKMLLIIFGCVMSTITIPSYLIKAEMQDGSLENLFVTLSSPTILLAKYCGMVISGGIGILSTFPIIIVFYSLPLSSLIYISAIMIFLLFQIIAIILLGNIIHAYFRRNTNIILSIIIPLIIPSLILASIAVNSLKIDFILILLGIDMVLIPIILVLSNYLLSNLYEF
jgi:ABC-type transport system involved in cytochrome c biogenesis permease component